MKKLCVLVAMGMAVALWVGCATSEKGGKGMLSSVKHEGSRVWIEGVPTDQVGGGWLAMLRGLGLLLRHRGEEVTEDDLLAYSGDAFHLCFADKWQYMGYMAIPTDIVGNVLAAYGYDGGLRHGEPMPQGADAQRQATHDVLRKFLSEIEAGRPVLVGGASDGGCCVWSVVVGYDTNNNHLCHMGIGEGRRWMGVRGLEFPQDPSDKGRMGNCWNTQTRGAAKPGFVGGWIDNAYVVLGDKTKEVNARDRVATSLKRAVQLHTASTHDPHWGWKFYFGATAYERWAEAMRALDYPADADKPVEPPLWDLYSLGEMGRMVNTVIRGRSAAAHFCEKAIAEMPAAEAHLRRAAEAYRQETSIASKALGPLLRGSEEERKRWLSQESNREAGAVAITQLLEQEKIAIAEISKALESLE